MPKARKILTLIGLGALLAGVIQFFVLHLIVQSAWAQPYSWAHNNVSDLGNETCAVQLEPERRYICSPDHALMNTSFVTLGVAIIVGLLLTGALWRRGTTARVLLITAGIGWVLVGLAPADVNENVHVLGAVLIMALGNVGLLLAGRGLSTELPLALRRAAVPLGLLALAGCVLSLSRNYVGLGMGGMERVAIFPSLFWFAAISVVTLVATRRTLSPGQERSRQPVQAG